MISPKSLAFALALSASALSAAPAVAQTLEQMAGQMIVVGFAGDSVADKSVVALRQQIADGTLGGVMYLKPNVASLRAVRAMNEAFRKASPDLPPFLTLDQEGGAVERLTSAVGFRELPNAETVAANNTPKAAGALYAAMAKSVAGLGFTVNFGPVVDLNVNPANTVIAKYGRAFGKSADKVVEYAEAFVDAHRQAGVLTSLKHFPGHGSSTADSHEGFVDVTDSWSKAELEPYKRMIDDREVDLVMIGHLINRDYSNQPSSLAPEWIDGVLRRDLGFKGVVISDDLEMGAIREHYNLKDTVTRAVRAGTDVLLFSNTSKPRAGLADELRAILVAEAEADPAFRARIEQSYARIVALKKTIAGSAAIPPADDLPVEGAAIAPLPQPRPARP
ncbi:MAG TPA: glycoside hydrolase family 3 N-terminal domain-containing protein [Devosia sp.]|nr:glycoside hydrolase family 3 N-terminal domain-containing protein [Devosia sp.]